MLFRSETHMKYMVSNQERPKNSPLYSIHTSLDSFILYNDDISNEQGLINEKSTNIVATPSPNIVATIDEEENEEKTKKSLLIQKITANRSQVLSIKTIMNIVPINKIRE